MTTTPSGSMSAMVEGEGECQLILPKQMLQLPLEILSAYVKSARQACCAHQTSAVISGKVIDPMGLPRSGTLVLMKAARGAL